VHLFFSIFKKFPETPQPLAAGCFAPKIPARKGPEPAPAKKYNEFKTNYLPGFNIIPNFTFPI
jgi:hypothetical protein